MLNKTIAICIIVIMGNAFGMKLSDQYSGLAHVTAERIGTSIGAAAPVIR